MLAAAPLYADEAEDQAVKAVEKLGGKVIRDYTNPARPYTQVDLSNGKITDAELKELAALKGLFYLNLFNTKVTDAGLKELPALNDLEMLELGYTAVTDAGLKNLAGLKKLRDPDSRSPANYGHGPEVCGST